MYGYHFLPAFWLPFLFSAFSANALPQAQSDFNIPLIHDGSTGTPASTTNQAGQGGDSDFVFKDAYPILVNDQLLTPELPSAVVVAENNNHNCRSSSSSSDINSQSSLLRKREGLVCLPQKPASSANSTPDSTPDPTPEPTPEPIAPLMAPQEPDDERCPPDLMGISRIPVCDSGRPGEDAMRLPGLDYFTLFNIIPNKDFSDCVHPSWAWCCASIGKQRHPLWLDRDDVTTGYICKDKEREEWFAEHPDLRGQSLDSGKDLEFGWKRRAKRAAH